MTAHKNEPGDQHALEKRHARDRRRLDALYGTERVIRDGDGMVVIATGRRALLGSAMDVEPEPFCAGATL
jgi:hypothetical protein